MATFTAVQTGGASADYMKYLYNGLSKDDRTSEPKLLDFSLVPWDGSFVKLTRGAYITVRSNTYAGVNLALWSEDFTNAVWNKSNLTVTTNATTAPDGNVTADKIQVVASSTALMNQTIAAAGNAGGDTYTIYVKQGSGVTDGNSFVLRNVTTATNLVSITLNYSTGAITQSIGSGATATAAANGFWRLSLPAASGISLGDSIAIYAGFVGGTETAGEFFYAWGAQLEMGPTATAYSQTTSSPSTPWYTGFVTNDPELEFLGGKSGAGQWGYKVQATSDEYLLNLKNIGIVPPFINTDQGTILKYLVRILTPAGYTFDVSGIGVGQKIPRYVVDPSKKFSDVVKEFADSANYRFWAIGMALHFVQRDSIACGIIVDGSSKHFTPSNLKLAPTSDSIINDVVVTGQIEPQNYITEYFVGDGVTGNIPMMSSVYGADSSLLLDDDFSASQTDLTKWTVFDTAANFLQVNNGFLNALGGNNNNAFDVYYQSANLIPLEGNLRITHGEYDFLNSGTGTIAGVIGGLWTGTPARTSDTVFPGCIYGIRVEQNGTLHPIANGVVDLTQSAVASTSKRYILRTVAYHRQVVRYLRQYSYFALGGTVGYFGGTAVVDIVDFQTYITEIDPTTAAITNQYVWANLSLSLGGGQTFAYYCPVVSNDLHCTVTGITLSTPMQAALWIKKFGASAWVNQIVGRNEIDSFDGLTPVATVTDQNNGVTTKSSLLGTSQYNSAQAVLQFFHDTTKQTSQIPQPGDQVYFRYRRPGAAIARVQDKVSIAAEATAWGDNGLRSLTNTSLSPLPRVSAECEFAAASIVKYTNYQHYQGTYTMERTPFITGVFTAEPLSGTVLQFQNLPASFPSYLQAEIVSQVQTTFDHSVGGECFTHSISFGSVDPAIGAVARLRRTDDVFNPQDSIEVPSYIDVSSVGNTFVPDVVAPTLDSYDSTTLHLNSNQAPPGLSPNLLLWTEDYTNAVWSKANATITANATTDPLGGSTADAVAYSATGTGSTLQQFLSAPSVTVANQTFTLSGWVKVASGTPTLNLLIEDQLFTVIANQAFTVTSSWQRFSVTGTASSTATGLRAFFYNPNTATTYFIWGAQLELGSTATAYISQAGSFVYNGGFEVRYTDESWGSDAGKNLITRTTGSTQTFAVPRNTRGKVCFAKAFDMRNKLLWSEDITNAAWQKLNGVPAPTVANATALNPDGKMSQISTVTFSAVSNAEVFQNSGWPCTGATAVFSVSLKGTAGQKVRVRLECEASPFSGTNVDVTFTGKWQRVSVSTTGAGTQLGAFFPIISNAVDSLAKSFQMTRASLEINATSETMYCKTNGSAYGAMSRFAAGIKVGYPLVPPSPTATINVSNPVLPVLNVVLPAALTDVWGIEIRASNNSTVLIHIDLTDASFVTSWVMPTNASRSPSYFVYTYNLLGEYSTAYNATASLPAPSASSVTTDEATMRVKWNMTFTLPIVETLFEIATDSGYTNIIYSDNGSGVSGTLLLGPSDFFPQRYFRVTPYDALGAGASATGNHVYTPTGVVEFNGNEVAVIPAPATPTTDPVVPTPLNDYPRDVVDAGWGNYKGNRLRYF